MAKKKKPPLKKRLKIKILSPYIYKDVFILILFVLILLFAISLVFKIL